MTKRIISVILVFVLSVLIVVPSFAASFNTLIKLEDASSSNSSYSSYGTVYDAATGSSQKFSYTVPDGGAAVLIFYIAGTDNDYSSSLFKSLSSASWAKSSKLNFVTFEWQMASQSTVKSYVSKYDTSGFVNKSFYNSSANYLITWYYNYVKNSGNMSNITTDSISPCFVIYVSSENGKKYIRYAETGVNSASQISSALSKFMDTSSLVGGGYDGYLDSGCASVAKLSKPGITALLDQNQTVSPLTDDGYFDTAPCVSGTYATGKVKDYLLQATANRLSALRNIAGLPSVTMDSTLNSQAQYGAVLLAASNFAANHKPNRPSDMKDDSFYNNAISATTTSNLAGGRSLSTTPDGFMKDEGDNNLPVMGHRRWQLNPDMKKVGFGFAINESNPYNSYKYYATEKCMDTSGNANDFMYVSWPASGNFPKELFEGDTAWSVTLNPSYYQTPEKAKVKVTLKSNSDNTEWTFSGNETYTVSSVGKYFNVETNGYGIGNCIIFRPAGISYYYGVYTVVISGLKDSFGNAVTLSYKVDFFDANEYREMEPGWYTDSATGRKYYFNDDGSMVKSKLMTIGGKKYYFGKDGAMYTKRLISVSGKKYYMGADGAAYTKRLISVNGKKYYMGADGVAYKSKLISVDGKKYYIGSDCVAYKSKLASIDGKKYYFGSDCVAYKSKLASIDGKKYYFGSDCVMYKSRLASISGNKYYFGKDGVAYKSKLISVSGKKYYIGKDCIAYKSKFASLSGKKYYFGSDCVMYKSRLASISGKKYYFGKDGVAYKSKLISVSGKKYYIGKDCIAYKSKFASLSGKKYYFGKDCIMYKSKTFSVSGVKWKADSNGVCKKV
ncbi:MAG: hypothetical protein K5755_04125 [Clostridiales bacterium]|nr:hypothetical protein [Clostridiales bacterium]